MAEADGRIDSWWKVLHQDDSKMPCEELRFSNPWLCRVAEGSSPAKCALTSPSSLSMAPQLTLLCDTKWPSTRTNLHCYARLIEAIFPLRYTPISQQNLLIRTAAMTAGYQNIRLPVSGGNDHTLDVVLRSKCRSRSRASSLQRSLQLHGTRTILP